MRLFLWLAVLTAQPASTDSPFNGTWLMDLASLQRPPEITIFSLEHGMFSRAAHGPGFAVKADGRVHAIAGDGYVDAVAATVFGPRRVREIDRLHGKIVYTVSYVVSADGRTMTERVVIWSNPDRKPIPTVTTRSRIGRPGPGSPMNGQWQAAGTTTTRGHLTRRFRLVGNRFSSTDPSGYGFDAVIGGPPAPVRGDTATAQSAVTMPDDRTIVEQGFVNGAPTATKTMTLLPDGRTIRVVMRPPGETADVIWMLRRQ